MLATKSHYSIGDLCDEFSVTARALRFYEDEALIAPERRGTQRLYPTVTALDADFALQARA